MKDKSTKKKKKSSSKQLASSQSLAVKYRPRTIDDLYGQESVSTQVRGMIKTGRFPSTIGLFGESGGGKTTTARMIARYINCLEPDTKSGEPCGTCMSCSYGDVHPDVHEINMANERGIDDARALISSSRSMPTVGNRRVFILDEMHACFPGDTRVLLASGQFATMWQIEKLVAAGEGVEVLSYNKETGEFEAKNVTHFQPKTSPRSGMVRVYVNQLGCQGYIESTHNHKIWSIKDRGMVEAVDLSPGAQLLSNINVSTEVTNVQHTRIVEGEEDTELKVYDLTVEDNHTYMVLPVGGTHPIVVSNCTPQALQTMLKPLEEPPEQTVWILATTNPEKLPSTILGRCHKFYIKPIAPDAITKRLRIIGKKEGVDFKELEGGKEILSTIANLSNGRMRDAISSLESVLFAIASGDEIDSKRLIKEFATTAEADMDKMAAHLVVGMAAGDSKMVLQAIIDAKNARGLIQKSRWLLQGVIAQSLDRAFFKTYSWRLFHEMAAKKKTQPRLSVMLQLQNLLCDIEIQLNSVSIDETVLFTSRVGAYLTSQVSLAPPKKKSSED